MFVSTKRVETSALFGHALSLSLSRLMWSALRQAKLKRSACMCRYILTASFQVPKRIGNCTAIFAPEYKTHKEKYTDRQTDAKKQSYRQTGQNYRTKPRTPTSVSIILWNVFPRFTQVFSNVLSAGPIRWNVSWCFFYGHLSITITLTLK